MAENSCELEGDDIDWDENSIEDDLNDDDDMQGSFYHGNFTLTDGADDEEMEYVYDEDYSNSQDEYGSLLQTGESSKSSSGGFSSPSSGSNNITASSSAITYSPFSSKCTSSDSEEFTEDEMKQMKERIKFELNVRRRRSPTHWASSELQEYISRLNFFKDSELNQLMSKMLLSLSFYNQVVSASIVVFFGVEAFHQYYLPNSIDSRQAHANKPPLPKYKLFHQFWRNINGSNPSKTFKTIIIITNFHLRRMPIGGYDGNLQKAYKSTSDGTPAPSCLKKPLPRVEMSGKKLKITTSPSTGASTGGGKMSKSSQQSNPKLQYQTRQPVFFDDGGNAFFVAQTGQKYFVNNPNQEVSYDKFFRPSRLLCMKARAMCILKENDCRGGPPVQRMKYAPESMEKMANLTYFPDEDLNKLMSQIMFLDHSIYKMVQIVSNVFWCDDERNTSIVPYRLPYLRLTHPPIIGHEFYYEFWDLILGFSRNDERKKIFEYAICNMNKFRLKEAAASDDSTTTTQPIST